MEQDEKLIKSKYSSGVNIILRLDQQWRDTHLHSRNDMFNKWNNDLDCIWRELARDLNETDYKSWSEKIKGVNDSLKKLGKFEDEKPAGFEEPSKDILKKREKQ